MPAPINHSALRRGLRLLAPLRRYHRFSLQGAEHVPASGPCLMVVHHSLITYDGFLLGAAIYEQTGRLPRGLGDDRIFEFERLGGFARAIGLEPASQEAGEALLHDGELLGVAPGGMWESLRPKPERRQSRWDGRLGFCRLAIRAGAPIMPAACPRADEVLTVFPSRLTDAAYRRLHWPVPLFRGVGPTLAPRPHKLTAFLGPTIAPPPFDPDTLEADAAALHAQVHAAMGALLALDPLRLSSPTSRPTGAR